ncbi:hypothetical protein [Paraclostridium sordellii]|uniref:hypothetical protein n=1 Tax=Paraclostridium sordellii TaxID=1505 RepID=UPI0012B06ABA|nr:hypothetical protein [Paeniclostridium sordellii]
MMINKNSDTLNELFFRELQVLVEKYNRIDEDTKTKIETIMETLKDEELKEYLMDNPNKLKDLIEEKNEKKLDKDIVIFFAWHNLKIGEVDVKKVKEYIEELQMNNYVELAEYIIYRMEEDLKEYAKEILEERLEQEYYVDKLFDKETIIEMWINRTTKEEMIKEIVDNVNIEEALELQSQYAFTFGTGTMYKYSNKDI